MRLVELGIVIACLSLPSGCDEEKGAYAPVTFAGMPRCPSDRSGLYVRPIVVELEAESGLLQSSFRARRVFIANPGPRHPGMSVPDEPRDYRLRFGLCRNANTGQPVYRCAAVDWYEQTRQRLDPSDPRLSTIDVSEPPRTGCVP